jgi:hypothetical protein
MSGTSMATPHVAGVIALIKAQFPDLDAAAIKSRLVNTVDSKSGLESRLKFGGRVNVASAMEIDTVAPGVVTDLAQDAAGKTNVTLSFTTTGDDLEQGSASAYRVRVSESPITNQTEWDAAGGPSHSLDMSRQDRVVVTVANLSFNEAGYYAVKAVDNVGNLGELSASAAYAVSQVRVVASNQADNMDNVTGENTWGLQELSSKGSAFSDSPEGSYAADSNSSLVFDSFDVGPNGGALVIKAKYDLESNYDFASYEISTDGSNWQQIDKVTGSQSEFSTKVYELELNGATSFQLRIRVISDYSVQKDGILIDAVTVLAE